MEICSPEMAATNFVWRNPFVEMGNCSLEKSVMTVTTLMVMVVILSVGLKETLFVKAAPVETQSISVAMEFLSSYLVKVVMTATQTAEMVVQALANQKQVSLVIISFSPQFVHNVVTANKTQDKSVMMLIS